MTTSSPVRSRLLPDTMFGRLVASLVLVVGIALAIVVALVLKDRSELGMRVGSVSDSAHRIQFLTHLLEALPRDARAAKARQLDADSAIRGEPEGYPGRRLTEREVAAIERAFQAELRDRLGERYRVAVGGIQQTHGNVIHLVSRNRPSLGTAALDVSVGLPDSDTLVFRVPALIPARPLPWDLFVQFGAVTIVLALVLFLVTRSITRPLSKLAQAADGVGRNVRHPPLTPEGVREIREATYAFNTMQDRLLRYLDSRTRVLAAMSHDLRTPLTRLRLRAESIADAQLHERFVADLEEMEALVHGALAVLKGLDDDEPFERVDIDALLARIAADYTETGARVTVEGSANEAVDAKPRALKRCIANLVDNALKFGQQATIRVDDGDALLVGISDPGPGVPEDQLERVFEPFYRLDASRSRDTGGTGLGLSIARDIAQAHGGTLTLRNRPEGGLSAELRLPRNQLRAA